MAKQLVFAILWLATAGIAFFAGTQMTGDTSRSSSGSRDAGAAPEYRVEESGPGSARSESSEAKGESAPGKRAVPKPEPYVEETFTLEGIETVEDLSAAAMAYARRKLNQGPEGQKELFRAMCALTEGRKLRAFIRDERQLMPLVYPWLRFAMDHERQIVDMMEVLYRTAAKEPQWFEGLSADPFELFTEGLAVLLPSVVDDERLERFRGYVRTILETGEEHQPEALRRNSRRFEKNLEMWGTPLTREQVIEILNDPSESDASKIRLIRSVPAPYLEGVDVSGIFAREMQGGNLNAYTSLRGLPLSQGQLVTLDRAFIEGISKAESQWYVVGQYLRTTGRQEWVAIKPFVEEGLRRGGQCTEKFVQALVWLPERPPVEYVRTVLETYEVPEAIRTQLKNQYKIAD